MPPASPGRYPRSASQFDPGSFLIPASALVSQSMRDFVCALYDQSLFPIATWLSRMQALEEFKARYSGGSSSQSRTPRLGQPMLGSDPSLLEENHYNWDYPPICGSSTPGVWVLTTVSLSFLQISLLILLCIFSCGKSFLVVFRSFSWIAAL